ncbi:MAG: hypothetical protein HY079_10625 [Elusimicrobia bacterium]|nr:hypothetical protein [Elusimicrobiota bacterium]
MKILSLAFALTLVVSPLAFAGGGGSWTNVYGVITNSLTALGTDADTNIASVKTAMVYNGTLPKDGPITLTRTVKDTSSSSTGTTETTSLVTVNLVMKNGKIASIDASATRTTVTTYSGGYASFMESFMKPLGVKFANPAKGDLGVSNIIQKSFDTSTPTPTPQVVVKNKKTPATGTDDTTKKPGTGDTTNAQQEVTAVVSPSAP